ncbi:MAG: LysE family transporter [Clostridiaceae bacterium]
MSYLVWLSFFSYNLITSITPGPMNIVAMNAAGYFGFRKSRSIFGGLVLGLLVVLLLCGLFSATLSEILPQMLKYMKYIGSGYIVWIAWTIVRSRPSAGTAQAAELDFQRAFFLQFFNVKAYIWAITVYTAYVLPYDSSLPNVLAFAGLMLLIATLCALIWALAGALLSSVLKKYWGAANGVMALMLFYSAISLLLA